MRLFLTIFFALLSTMPTLANAAPNDTLAIIVAPQHYAMSFTKSELALIFWRKKRYWADGRSIQPVNLPANNALRSQFSTRVLGSLPESQTDYWNGLYFHGVSPPLVLNSYEAALRYVAETQGAIAYIPACNVDDRVKVIAWLDHTGALQQFAPVISCSE